ncbi:hypothetical protein SLH46_20415 [Draconibacterium sp. IB214405]|uniref:hypothetical protein n=1 Tax=Draconibacterium sp. IB214405 TaxID=3097352 RepID=UPI002A147AA2|nr:hypothetical protein [Draconibacterium sp. IB214405]MDX8341574.1 hypothetical protein [Draconibacterium sp. IB214405]
MKIKITITRKLIAQLAVFMAVIAAAFVLDVYFGNHPEELEKIQAESQEQNNEKGTVYLITQTAQNTTKTFEDRVYAKHLKVQLHDKFLRNYHSVRNYQVLKAEVAKQTSPLISSYHYLVFQNHVFSPDEDSIG